jgi:hypothetical protein
MHFFISGELDGKLHQDYTTLSREISSKLKTLEVNDYGSEFVDIGVIMIIIDRRRGIFDDGTYKERKLIHWKTKAADIRLITEFDTFQAADYEGRRLLLLDNLIRSIKVIAGRSKGDFNGEQLITDIYRLFSIEPKMLENL